MEFINRLWLVTTKIFWNYLWSDFLSIFNIKNLVFYLGMAAIFFIADYIAHALIIRPKRFSQPHFLFSSFLNPLNWPPWFSVLFIVLGAIPEEILFRFPVLVSRLNRWWIASVLVAYNIAMIWALGHKFFESLVYRNYSQLLQFSWLRVSYLFVSGLLYGACVIISASLWPAVIVHVFHNLYFLAPIYFPNFFIKIDKLLTIR